MGSSENLRATARISSLGHTDGLGAAGLEADVSSLAVAMKGSTGIAIAVAGDDQSLCEREGRLDSGARSERV